MSCRRRSPTQDSHIHLPGQKCKWRPTEYVFKYLKVINQANKLTKYAVSSYPDNNLEGWVHIRIFSFCGFLHPKWWHTEGQLLASSPGPASLLPQPGLHPTPQGLLHMHVDTPVCTTKLCSPPQTAAPWPSWASGGHTRDTVCPQEDQYWEQA